MKRLPLLLLLILACLVGRGQSRFSQKIDSLTRLLKMARTDSLRVDLLNELGRQWQDKNLTTSITYLRKALTLAQQHHLDARANGLLFELAYDYFLISDAPKSIELLLQLMQTMNPKEAGYTTAVAFLSLNYKAQHDYPNALFLPGKRGHSTNRPDAKATHSMTAVNWPGR